MKILVWFYQLFIFGLVSYILLQVAEFLYKFIVRMGLDFLGSQIPKDKIRYDLILKEIKKNFSKMENYIQFEPILFCFFYLFFLAINWMAIALFFPNLTGLITALISPFLFIGHAAYSGQFTIKTLYFLRYRDNTGWLLYYASTIMNPGMSKSGFDTNYNIKSFNYYYTYYASIIMAFLYIKMIFQI